MNTEQQSQIIQVSLLKWVSLLIRKTVTSFQQLSTGEFYINLLSQVRQFKFIKPLKDISQTNQQQQSSNLVNKISNMKIIGDSILRYYQTHLMRDVSGVRIDYVQLCMGNRSQAIKLFSLVVGVIGQSEGSDGYKKFIQTINNLQLQDQDIVKALLQNSRNIGQCITRRQESPIKKRMLSKLETYEDKIQSLQFQLQSLRQHFQEEKLTNQSLQKQIKQLKTQKTKLIQKVQVLELLNTRLQSQNSSFQLQNQNIIKKLQSQKRHYDTMLTKNQQVLMNYEKQISVVNLMKDKIQQLKSANNQLKQRLNDVLKQQHEKQTKFHLMKQNYKLLQENYIKTQQKLTSIQLQYQNYRFQQEKCSGMKGTGKILSSPAYHISNNSQLSSINYRVKDSLGSLIKAQLSQVQMVDSNIVHRLRQTSGTKSKGSTLKNQQFLMSSHLQNFSHFALNSMIKNRNLRDIEDVSEFDGQFSCQNYKINQQQLDKSLIIGEDEEIELRNSRQNKSHKQYQQKESNQNQNQDVQLLQTLNPDEQKLLIIMIQKLYNQNEQLKSQLQKYQALKNQKQHRLQVFKQKLSKIRQIQPISQIDSKFQQQKQNISQNGFPIFLMTEKQSIHEKDHLKKSSPQDSSQRYSYYPLVLN